nr:reverse transcriptase domain-containing protein [Tanacetum cinerariifolium]
MQKYGVTHRLATPYHPQTSGQVGVSNRGLKRILERAVGENRASWSDKLDDALWAFCIAYKTPIGCTPYKKVQINELNKLRDQAYENSLIYKKKTKMLHDSKIKNRVFNIGDRVLLFNSRLKIFSGKLKSRRSGPFTISQVYPYGIVELSQPDEPNFKVNGYRLKHYFGEDVPNILGNVKTHTKGFCPPVFISSASIGNHVPQDYDAIFRYAMFIYSFYLCYVLSLYPFTERYAQPYFFSCLIRQMVNTRTDADLSAARFALKFARSSVRVPDRQMLVEIPHRLLFIRGLNALISKSLIPLRRRQLQWMRRIRSLAWRRSSMLWAVKMHLRQDWLYISLRVTDPSFFLRVNTNTNVNT